MVEPPTRYATLGCYVLLGVSAAVIGFCRAIEAANYWMKKPTDRLKQQ